ncbi:MAG: hypothetical protein FWG63_11500 [Defluviitaleaceae bacterium]|nr:hypothetical protein [Defluviitaleaceae bacterium]
MLIPVHVFELVQFGVLILFMLANLALCILILLNYFFGIGDEEYEILGRYWVRPIPTMAWFGVLYTLLDILIIVTERMQNFL